MTRLDGRTVLIAGASSGLGAGFARLLAMAGAKVVLGARRLDKTEVIARELVDGGAEALAAFEKAEACFGPVNGVIANAGTATGGRSTDIAAIDLKQVLDTNLLGTYLVAREEARRMMQAGSREREDGRIVLIGSITAEQNGTGDAAYAATKACVAHLGKQFAREWIRQGINVNTLQPGWILTEINAGWFATAQGQADIQALHRRRLLEPAALHELLLFLMSDASRTLTGAVFTIDDGQSL